MWQTAEETLAPTGCVDSNEAGEIREQVKCGQYLTRPVNHLGRSAYLPTRSFSWDNDRKGTPWTARGRALRIIPNLKK